jgi:ring-1,2-phenylacetyl-CoA epoxidase subunit PaaE
MQEQIIQFTITAITQQTADVFTFSLNEISGKKVNYEAGQFLTFLFRIQDIEVRRSYSISSSPDWAGPIQITLQRIPNGVVSRLLVDTSKPGDILKAIEPAGKFVLPVIPPLQFCFIAAGSGISPVFSLMKTVLRRHAQSKILLIFQNRNEETTIFRKELLQLQENYPDRMQMIELFSQPLNKSIVPARLNNFKLEEIIRNCISDLHAHFYLCGPRSFMMLAEVTLTWLGFGKNIKKENFVVDAPPPPPLLNDTSSKKIELNFQGEKFEFVVKYPQNILSAALAQGIPLPYSCRGGQCSTCMVKCKSGKIIMSKNEVLTSKDLAEGWVLTCVGFAETDLVLEKK